MESKQNKTPKGEGTLMNIHDIVVKQVYLVHRNEWGEIVDEVWLGNTIEVEGEQHFLSVKELEESQTPTLKKGGLSFPFRKDQ